MRSHMNKNTLPALGVAILFGVLGAGVAIKREPAAPVTVTMKPTDGRPHTTVTALFAESMNDAAGVRQPLAQWQGKPLIVNFWAPGAVPASRKCPSSTNWPGTAPARTSG